MTPAARAAAAIEILDRILGGAHPEQVLTNWGRASRYAGSGDRAAVRDLVYDGLRRAYSSAARGGGMTGRGVVIGLLREQGTDPATLFTGQGHAPAPLTPADTGRAPDPIEALDCPAWLAPLLMDSLGSDFAAVMDALRQRAPVFLRANLARTDRAGAIAALATDGIVAVPHDLADTALRVETGARALAASRAYQNGLVELQDASSQAVVQALPLRDGMRVLDYCAGGGGKALAMAARARLQIDAHDADPRRMADLPPRAKRSGVTVKVLENAVKADSYDLVLTDVPCSGSGSWRRDPFGKISFNNNKLQEILRIQDQVIRAGAAAVAPGGVLAYATCSMLSCENGSRVAEFFEKSNGWRLMRQFNFSPLSGGDGFYLALLQREGG